MIKKWIALGCTVGLLLTGCGQRQTPNTGGGEEPQAQNPTGVPEQMKMPESGDEIAIMTTNMGTIKIRLFPQYAPKAVENFTTHAKDGYYDGLIFHRVIEDFMIQGGDPQGTGMGGESIWGEAFEDEFDANVLNLKGALSMANSGPNTNGSQFFIVQKAVDQEIVELMKQNEWPQEIIDVYGTYGGTPWLDFQHTVFGQVFEGLDIVDTIAALPTGDADRPKEDVVIESIEITQYEE